MPFEKFLELAYRYGSPLVYSGVFLFGLYKFSIRILNSYDKREEKYVSLIDGTMKHVTDALLKVHESCNSNHQVDLLILERISKEIKDGFERMYEADKYQREEHKEILTKIRSRHE